MASQQSEDLEGTAALKRALFAVKDMRSKLDAIEQAKTEPIAIVGMACRFPGGANTPESYWKILDDGLDVITDIPADRWDPDKYFDPDPNAPGKMYTRKSAFLDNIDKFEPQFFGISPREANSMDPQQRLLLEVTWEALENAGIVPARLAGSQGGVFVGISTLDYYNGVFLKLSDLNSIDAYTGTGTGLCIAAGRIAYVLGLHGPTLSLDTACSSSLVAVHLGVQSLRAGQTNLVIAAGVNLVLAPEGTITMSKTHALAADGYCKTFDAAADGYTRGEGCGVVILKRLSDAVADGDNILALIRGSAINHDGRSSGLTVPNGQAQQAVVRAAMEDARVDPHQVHYVETHGTGTQLGDPIEVRALAAALGKGRSKEQALVLGSVKANIGHLEAAAGMSGLIKIILSLQNQKIPRQLHFKDPNPNIEWDVLPVRVAGENEVWRESGSPRMAGINSFGFSGTNAHVLLQEAPAPPAGDGETERPQHILTLSGNDENALADLAGRFVTYLEHHPEARMADVAFTTNRRRTHFDQRLAVVAKSNTEFREKLTGFINRQSVNGLIAGQSSASNPKIVFLFTGQGSQYVEMGRQLHETEPVFRSALERCNELLRPYLEKPLVSVLYPKPGEESPINETAYTQPALFALEYALAELWRSWGITPSAVMGHSVGEYVAACVSGLFSLEDGLKLIAERGRLMQSLPRDGAMAAVYANADRVAKAIAPYATDVSIAAYNGPDTIVISGRESVVQTILEGFAAEGVKASRLAVSHAFHSPLMDPILDAFEHAAASIKFSKPATTLVSNVTGNLISFEEISQPRYWRTHIRQPVQFHKGMETLRDQGFAVFLEIGPQPTLLGMGQRCITGEKNIWLPSLRQRKDDISQMLESLGSLHVHGVEVDWAEFHRGHPQRSIPLPAYAFQRQRYWFKPTQKKSRPERQTLHPLLGHKLRSPRLAGSVYETELGVDLPSFLDHHRIFDTAIFPGTGYIEMAFAAAKHAFGAGTLSLSEIVIREALVLPEEGEKIVQILLSSIESGKATFDIFSLHDNRNSAEESWKHHASGNIILESGEREHGQSTDLETWRENCKTQIDIPDFYSELADLGIGYGPSFQAISQAWHGEAEALGRIKLSNEDAEESHKFTLHPALLDACFQLTGAVIPKSTAGESAGDKVYVPVGLQSLKVYRAGQSSIWAHVSFPSSLTSETGSLKDTLIGNIKLLDDAGSRVAEITGLQLRQISRAAILPLQESRVEDWLYEFNWQSAVKSPTGKISTRWLVFADSNGIGDSLGRQLRFQGMSVTLITRAADYQQIDPDTFRLNPNRKEDFQRFVSTLKGTLQDEHPGIIHLWGMTNPFDAADQKSEPALREGLRLACGSILHIVQSLEEQSIQPAGLWLVTEGVHGILPDDRSSSLVQSAMWGLARTIATEYPNWKCACIDITSDSRDGLLDEILAQDDENQIALRGNTRYLARLDRLQAGAGKVALPGHPFELAIPTPGMLDGLTLEPVSRRTPEANEVEIRVKASGLNFRDVLNALGMYPGAKIPLGIECAGIVEAVGDGVTEFKIGDEVIGLTGAAFRSFATIPVERVFAKPVNVTLAQAVSVPTIFLTAAYGLHNLAGMKAGDRVLIHAAAGGVGLAAVQLAQRAGAEIFATAGSPEKHAYLKSLGVKHIFDSRSLGFADEIMRVTDGKGVNIILNSLADEFIPKSLSVLADHGCFLEMGKRDDWDQTKVSQLNPTLKYHRYDLGLEMVNDMPFIRTMLNGILSDFEQGILKPLPLRAFPMEDVREAFRFMAQAKHIGKVIITQEAAPPISPEGTYLITGGLGGLGLVTARWLVERGAKYVALMSRSEPAADTAGILDEIRGGGAEITAIQGDVSRREDVERALQIIASTMAPLRGIFHEAGILDDGVLTQQDWSRFERVMNPKVYGAWHLHELTQGIPLDFFILFSSAASVMGSAGQGNYAAANSFLDGLAHHRRSIGLPAMSINWGSWGNVGMAADLENRMPNRRAGRGVVSIIKPDEGMKALDKLMGGQSPQSIVLPINWNQFSQQQGGRQVSPLLRQLLHVQAKPEQTRSGIKLLEQIKALPAGEREDALQQYVRKQVLQTLGLDPAQAFNPLRVLTDLGLDSLMAVELKNKIESDFGLNLPVTFFLEGVTMTDLAKKLHQELGNGGGPETSASADSIDPEKAKQLLENLDQLADSEVDSLLDNLLANNEER